MMVSSIVGIQNRSTMDIDATLKNINLSESDTEKILSDIIKIELPDGITFCVKSVAHIMDEAEYPGIRASLEARLDNMKIPLKIDFSTGDAITPKEIEYKYSLMFEKRTICIMAYNVETILAEKLETVLSRSVVNTRMRDFYDICILYDTSEIDYVCLKSAFAATCENRRSESILSEADKILEQIHHDGGMKKLWENYQRKYEYARDYGWEDVINIVHTLAIKLIRP